MNHSSISQKPPFDPNGPGSIHPNNVPKPPPGVVAGSLAACLGFVIIGFGTYFLLARYCRDRPRRGSNSTTHRCIHTPMPLSPLSPWGRPTHTRDCDRGRGSPGIFDGGFPGTGTRTKCSAARDPV